MELQSLEKCTDVSQEEVQARINRLSKRFVFSSIYLIFLSCAKNFPRRDEEEPPVLLQTFRNKEYYLQQ